MLCCQYCGRALPNNSAVCECRMKPALDDGGPAFPHDNQELGNRHRIAQPGMSLRDWFAGQALAGIFAGGYRTKEIQDMASGTMGASTPAGACYALADAMLAERAKRGK